MAFEGLPEVYQLFLFLSFGHDLRMGDAHGLGQHFAQTDIGNMEHVRFAFRGDHRDEARYIPAPLLGQIDCVCGILASGEKGRDLHGIGIGEPPIKFAAQTEIFIWKHKYWRNRTQKKGGKKCKETSNLL
jgi:hypothetical protein